MVDLMAETMVCMTVGLMDMKMVEMTVDKTDHN
jgi:hypothetical protein